MLFCDPAEMHLAELLARWCDAQFPIQLQRLTSPLEYLPWPKDSSSNSLEQYMIISALLKLRALALEAFFCLMKILRFV